MLCSVVKYLGSGRALKKWGKTLDCVSCFPLHFFLALPLPACFTTEQSTVEASLFVNYADSKLPSGVSYCIPSISENFVRTSLQQLSTSKATGLDDLSSYFLKTAASSISPSLTVVFNLSISPGVFPDLWKTA